MNEESEGQESEEESASTDQCQEKVKIVKKLEI